jgi:hypothetical protein
MNAEISARPRRRWLYIPFILLALVAAGWSALWFYGRSRINVEIDNFFARQATAGRDWSCPDRVISGFPFRIEGRCSNPSYRQRGESGEIVNGQLKGLTVIGMTADVLSSGMVITEFEGPLVVKAAGLPDTSTTFKIARSSLRGGIGKLERLSLEVDSPVSTIGGTGGSTQWRADKITAHLVESTRSAGGNYDLVVQIENAQIPELDQALNSRDAINLKLDAIILKPGAIDRRDWRKTIDNWRLNGGTMKIESLSLSKGAPRLEAKGDLRLDDQRRPEGRLDANLVNAGPLLQLFGVNVGGGGVGGLVGNLLGGNRAGGQPRDMAVRLPFILEGGRAALGPFRIPGLQLRPLF